MTKKIQRKYMLEVNEKGYKFTFTHKAWLTVGYLP